MSITIPFVQAYSFEAVLKDGSSGFQNSRPHVVKVSKLFSLKIYFQAVYSCVMWIYCPNGTSSGAGFPARIIPMLSMIPCVI